MNIPDSFAVIEVIRVEDYTHFVKLHLHSMNKYINMNDHLSYQISLLYDKPITENGKDTANRNANCLQENYSPLKSITSNLKSNFDYAKELIAKVHQAHNILLDEDVSLINVKIVKLVSPFEFYALPLRLPSTSPYYEHLFEELQRTAQESRGSRFELKGVLSKVVAYFSQTKKAWRRGSITQVCPFVPQVRVDYGPNFYHQPKPRTVTEYRIRDYDDFTSDIINIPDDDTSLLFELITPLPERLASLHSQALHCVLLVDLKENENPFAANKLNFEHEFSNSCSRASSSLRWHTT